MISGEHHFFITGGAGYIGSIFVDYLLRQNQKVTVLDNFFYKQDSLKKTSNNKNLEIIIGDVRDTELVTRLMIKADVVVLLAALVGAPICDKHPALAEQVNLLSPRQIFKKISKNQILLMPTTNSAYGSGDANNFCDENTELKPISLYARQKVQLETDLMQTQNAISFRLATVFGYSPRMRLDLLVNDFTFRAKKYKKIDLFEGHFKRNYLHVKDVTRVFIHAIENFDVMKGQIYNVGISDANISKLQLCERIKIQIPEFEYTEIFGKKDPDQRNYIVSNKKIESTGFNTAYSLDFGISEIIDEFPNLNEATMRNA